MGLFGWGRRMENSRGGAFFGFFLCLGAVFLLFTNEGRAVKRYKDLKEGAGIVVTVPADKIDPANNKKLVHLTGKPTTGGPVVDTDFGISETAIKLIRKTTMYQWVESTASSRAGDKDKEREVVYKKEWRSDLVDSSAFVQKEGRTNPTQMKYKSATVTAQKVSLGAFTLPDFLVSMINNDQPYPLASLDRAPDLVKKGAQLQGGDVYFGNDPSNPQIGDTRVTFALVTPETISAIAVQKDSTFAKYKAATGGSVALLEIGEHEAAEMFKMAQDRNKTLTWMLRVAGFFMLGFGFSMILGPLAAIASIVPLLGNVVGAGTKLIGFLLAAMVWTLTVGVAWIFYRPLLGITLLVLAVVLLVVVIKKLVGGKTPQAPSASGPPDASPPPFST